MGRQEDADALDAEAVPVVRFVISEAVAAAGKRSLMHIGGMTLRAA